MRKLLLVLSLFVGFSAFSQSQVPSVYLQNLEGDQVNIRELTNVDHVTVLSFWATWCMPCLRELGAIQKVYGKWQEETDVQVIAIATDDSRTQNRIKPLVNGKNWDYTVLVDTNQDLKRRFHIPNIPHTIVVKNNKVLYRHSGYVPGAEKELFEIIKKHAN